MATDLSTVSATEAKQIAVSERSRRQKMADMLEAQSVRVRRSIVVVGGAGALGLARGYYNQQYKLLGVDMSLVIGVGAALTGAMLDDETTADVAVDVADAAFAEYAAIQGVSLGMTVRVEKNKKDAAAAKANAGGVVQGEGQARTMVDNAVSVAQSRV